MSYRPIRNLSNIIDTVADPTGGAGEGEVCWSLEIDRYGSANEILPASDSEYITNSGS